MRRHTLRFSARSAFSLIELLVVIGIIAIVLSIMLPSLGNAKRVALRTKCLANIRNLELAQQLYAADNASALLHAGSGSYDVQGSWLGMLQPYAGTPLLRRCPMDLSPYFETANTDYSPPAFRMTSYAINNYVSPSHAPLGTTPISRITQVARPSSVIQFVELAETGTYALADHLHVQDFYSAAAPSLTLNRISAQMPVGRHGGAPRQWTGVLNFGFLDGHAETLMLKDVYTNPSRNKFNPAALP